ncbi:peptidase associated/transthyretin-like domain-containing protein [Mucilaginibacter polytrichastri]|uniref:TonB-dependent receptor plug domain-containing protein n=1 Tax=Mucilaginibacter polytrichastri TaxID=1302689 RepID=A0A1Q6A1I0_9SPHI|nr:carboxypeptidase-like regulatory domain-containing protein [Mucilaginibacter polytrichastri]OKS87877.1 hypothetical protein RG47T_3340 [Mucilaginibacter polytrichastri]SFT27479.1 CarboxypepD_reg-like domain-containing protein [Mucilaginibacter polytrichastri]
MASFSYAQHAQEGVVFENKTHVALAGITVENLNGKYKTVTDKQGRFSLTAKISDMLVLNGFGYKPDTVVVTDLHAREFYMDPLQHLLNEVEINGKGAVNESIFKQRKDPDFHNQTMTYQRNKDGTVKGGINLRIWSNKKTENEAKKRELEAKNDKITAQIQQAFSKESIEKYVPLKDQELHSFIMRYSPDIETFTSEEFNLAAYLNKCYKEFVKLSPEERLKASIFGN